MYGPPLDCKGRFWERKYSLRKCIRPLSEIILRGPDDEPRVLVLISRTVNIDPFEEERRSFSHSFRRDRSHPTSAALSKVGRLRKA